MTHTLAAWSAGLGVSRETLRRRLGSVGEPCTGQISVKAVVRAYSAGGMDSARQRETMLRGDLLELDLETKRGELCSMEDAKETIRSALAPISHALRDLPDRFAERSWPADPAWGRGVLLEIQRELMDKARQGLAEPKAKPKARKPRAKAKAA